MSAEMGRVTKAYGELTVLLEKIPGGLTLDQVETRVAAMKNLNKKERVKLIDYIGKKNRIDIIPTTQRGVESSPLLRHRIHSGEVLTSIEQTDGPTNQTKTVFEAKPGRLTLDPKSNQRTVDNNETDKEMADNTKVVDGENVSGLPSDIAQAVKEILEALKTHPDGITRTELSRLSNAYNNTRGVGKERILLHITKHCGVEEISVKNGKGWATRMYVLESANGNVVENVLLPEEEENNTTEEPKEKEGEVKWIKWGITPYHFDQETKTFTIKSRDVPTPYSIRLDEELSCYVAGTSGKAVELFGLATALLPYSRNRVEGTKLLRNKLRECFNIKPTTHYEFNFSSNGECWSIIDGEYFIVSKMTSDVNRNKKLLKRDMQRLCFDNVGRIVDEFGKVFVEFQKNTSGVKSEQSPVKSHEPVVTEEKEIIKKDKTVSVNETLSAVNPVEFSFTLLNACKAVASIAVSPTMEARAIPGFKNVVYQCEGYELKIDGDNLVLEFEDKQNITSVFWFHKTQITNKTFHSDVTHGSVYKNISWKFENENEMVFKLFEMMLKMLRS